MAARRQCPDRAGHAAPGRAFITASTRSSRPALPFPFWRPFFPAAAAVERRSSAVAIAARSPRLATPAPPPSFTVFSATHCSLPCSLTKLGKPLPRV